MTSCWHTSSVSRNADSHSATCVPSYHLLMTSSWFCGYAGSMSSCYHTSLISRNPYRKSKKAACVPSYHLLTTSLLFCGYAGSMTSCWQILAAPNRAQRPSNLTPSIPSPSSSSSRLSLISTGQHTGACLSRMALDSSMPSA